MKKIFTILFILVSVISFGQSVVQRATQDNTVADARLMTQLNFFIPRYTDTTAANNSIGIDTLGAIIFTYNVNNFWIRVGNPKHWQQGSGGGTVLPDGVYSGGQVAYAGSGYDYIESAATYVLGGVIYNSPQDTITLNPSDVTFNRVDVIGLSSSGFADKVTGVPGANPLEPSVNPQTFIRRSIVTVVANTTQPPNIDQTIIYDEGTGEPTEWTPASEGNTDFLDVQNPYHLTIDALTVAINPNQRIYFVNDDTVNSGSRSSLVIFTNLLQPLLSTQNINAQLRYQGNPVSVLLPLTKYGLLSNLTNKYQMSAIPFSEFSTSNIIFDEVDLILTGVNPFPFFYDDYIQIQTGLSPIIQIPNQKFGDPQGDNFTSINRAFDFNNNAFRWNNVNKFIVKTVPSDSSFVIRAPDNTDIFRADASNNIAFMYQLRIGPPATPTIISDPAAFRIIGPNFFQQFVAGSFIEGYQQSISLKKSYPTAGFTSFVKIVNEDTLGAQGVDSLVTNILEGAYKSPIDNIERTKFYVRTDGGLWSLKVPHTATADTFFVWKNGLYQGITAAEAKIAIGASGNSNSNIGSGFILAIPTTNNIKTLFVTNGILADSATNTNGITFQMDSSQYATKAYVQSVAGGGGFTGVTSFAFTNANGFTGSVANSTTTPALTLNTSVADGRLMYSTSGAPTGSANLTWVNATNRLGIGATSAAYLSLAPSTTSQASLNLGNAGTAPTSPQNADVWVVGNHILVRLNGVTTQLDAQATSGVQTVTGVTNQTVITGTAVNPIIGTVQNISTISSPTFASLTLGGTAATTPLTFVTNTDATASAGRWYYNTTRLGFSLAATILRVPLTNDVAPTAGQGIFGNGTGYTVGNYAALNNSVLVAATASGVTFRTNSIVQTLSGTSVTMNINSGENAQWTLTATGSSLAITNPIAGRMYIVNAVQDGTGSRTITTYPAGTVWYSGTAPTLKTTAGAVNTLAFYYNGSNYYGYDWGSGGGSGFANPMTTLGDAIYGGASGVATRLAGNTTANIRVLAQTGTGVVSAAPAWTDIISSFTSSATLDFPSIAAQSRQELTIPVTGAIVGDGVIVGATINQTNVIFTGRVSAAGIVTVQANNFGAIAQNPAQGLFKVIVVR